MTHDYNNNPEYENFLFGKDKKLPFIVPDGYFQNFESLLRNKLEVLEEAKEFPLLSAIDKERGFVVPQNYFGPNANQLEVKCELSAFATLSSIPKVKLPGSSLINSTHIIASAEADDELLSFGTLSAIKKKNEFQVAPSYFENASDSIKEAVHSATRKETKVISFFLRPKAIMAYAAAIVITVCAVFYIIGKKNEMVPGDCKTLACLEKNEILNEQTLGSFSEEDLYEMVDVDQLATEISSADSLSTGE